MAPETTAATTLELPSFPEQGRILEAQQPREQYSENPNATKSSARLSGAYLDGFRGVAAIGVFNHHLLGDGQSAEDNQAWAAEGLWGKISACLMRLAFKGGYPAVAIFFILSGYVLCLSTFNAIAKDRRQQCRPKLLAGALRRPFRLYLPCLAVGFACALLMQLPFDIYPDALWYQRQPNIFAELWNFTKASWQFFQPFRQMTVADHYAYNPVFWAIPITLKGSLMVYAILGFLTYIPISRHYLAGSLAAIFIFLMHQAYWWPACFFIGMAIAVLRSEIGSSKATASWPSISMSRKPTSTSTLPKTILSWAAVTLGVYLISAPCYDGHPELSAQTHGWYHLTLLVPSAYTAEDYYRFWHCYGAVIFILGLMHTPLLQRVLTTRPVMFVGGLSFMFYAIHYPLFMVIGDRWRRVLGQVPYMAERVWYDDLLRIPDIGPESMPLRAVVIYWTILAMVLVVARWATKWIDEPCGRFTKKIGEGIDRQAGKT